MMKWVVYMLYCPPIGNRTSAAIYVGITTDFSRRLQEHKSGTGAKYTRANPPTYGVIIEDLSTRSEALKREYYYKSFSADEKLKVYLCSGGSTI